MNDALFIHRIHFAFTITYHYIFPQLTMGLAPLIVVLKTLALAPGTPTTTMPRGSGSKFSASTSSPESSPASPWNFSSAPTGRDFRSSPAA